MQAITHFKMPNDLIVISAISHDNQSRYDRTLEKREVHKSALKYVLMFL